MANLIKKNKMVERKRNGVASTTIKPYVICSCCQNQIYSPTPIIYEYKHCYHCGAKFDTPVNANEIKKIINTTKSED